MTYSGRYYNFLVERWAAGQRTFDSYVDIYESGLYIAGTLLPWPIWDNRFPGLSARVHSLKRYK